MVKFTTKALISFLSLASLGLSAPSCSQSYVERSADTIAKIKNDIIVISDTLNAWKGSVDNFPTTGGSVNAAFDIDTQAQKLATLLVNGTADVTFNGAIALLDGEDILASVQGLKEPIRQTLIVIVAKKEAFQNLGVRNIVPVFRQTLTLLGDNTKNFVNALIDFNVASLQGPGTTLRDEVVGYFKVAIDAYSTV